MRFCPYCGNELSDRSKFCPFCGKASPARRRGAAVAVEDRPRVVTRTGEVLETTRTGPRGTNGAASPFAPRRYAPPAHAFIRAFEQAGFVVRSEGRMFALFLTPVAQM